MLKYPLYIRSVTNLSEARYCAGMGVAMVGFCFDANNEDFIDITTAKTISGWLSGVKIVAEFGKNTLEEIQNIISELNPDFLSIDKGDLIAKTNIPAIFRVDLAKKPTTKPPIGTFLLLEDSSSDEQGFYTLFQKNQWLNDYDFLMAAGFNKDNINEIQTSYHPYGYSLKGNKEIAPGLNNYEYLADLLEALEIDD